MARRLVRRRMKANPNATFSYKQHEELGRYVSPQGSILPRSETNLTQKQQRELARAIKRARHLALMQFTQTV